MRELGRVLVATGLVLAACGVVLLFGHRLPWLGHLPGDLLVRRGQFTLYVPLATCLIVSVVLSLLWMLLRR